MIQNLHGTEKVEKKDVVKEKEWEELKIEETFFKEEEKHYIREKGKKEVKTFEFDIAISVAGEDRHIAENLVRALSAEGVKVFYDNLYKYDLWGKDLRVYFQGIYGPKARFVLLLISKYYPIKEWTDFEFSIMRDEAKRRKNEFILPIKLDDTKMIGISESIAYLDYRKEGIDGIVDCLLKKLSQELSD